MRIAIFGVEGQLGRDVETALAAHDVVGITEAQADITDDEAVMRCLDNARPDWVINCAAMTDVDRCETETIPAFQVNGVGARNVARACTTEDARLIHISTDYVFDGDTLRPYVETDAPNPLNVYGMSKLAGEYFVRNECDGSFIIRTSGLYGTNPCVGKGTNFVETMLRLGRERSSLRVVSNERLTPTYTVDLAEQLRVIVDSPPDPGIYHATNSGECSWFEFASEIFRMKEVPVQLEEITAQEWGSTTRRPLYSVLENAALGKRGLNAFPDWRDALGRYLAERDSD